MKEIPTEVVGPYCIKGPDVTLKYNDEPPLHLGPSIRVVGSPDAPALVISEAAKSRTVTLSEGWVEEDEPPKGTHNNRKE